MNKLAIYTLKILQKSYKTIYGRGESKPICEQNADKASRLIYDSLISEEPLMIARFGSTELTAIVNYLGVKEEKNILDYIKGKSSKWWWEPKIISQIQVWSGFFPPKVDKIEQFCELMLEDKKFVDILGSWLVDETLMEEGMHATKVHLRLLEPFWSNSPWTKALKGKNILVVHPFSKTILRQYENREYLFENKDVLPKFKSLTVIKAVQSLGKEDDRFNDWFEALDYMKSEIDKVDYDVCLIAAGAYGFPLAAHVKRKGKKSIHLGGALQLLFGIRGKRWEDPNYGVVQWGLEKGSYSNMMNNYWTRPNEDETPAGANKVEGACYW